MELLNRLIFLKGTYPLAAGHATTIGNFDGCHLGHQRLFAETRALADEAGLKSLALSFSPNPRSFFAKSDDLSLFTNDQKVGVLGELGVEAAYLQHFDEAFARLTAEEFYRGWLVEKFRTRALIVGHDFHFGAKRAGDGAFLTARCAQDGIKLHIEPAFRLAGDVLSTTAIKRKLREEGDVRGIQPWLGRPYLLEGIIEKGAQLGRKLGFPTANLGMLGQVIPRDGIYACRAVLAEGDESIPILQPPKEALAAVISIGTRPTVDQSGMVKVEAHLLEGHYSADALYGKRLGLYFHHRLRDELRFNGLEELKTAIAEDCARARQLLDHSP